MSDANAGNDRDGAGGRCELCGEREATTTLGTGSVCEACYTDATGGGSGGDRDEQGGLADQDIRRHYEHVADAVAPLAELDGDPTMLVDDRRGWYVTRENATPDGDDLGRFEKERRPRSFAADYADTAERVERTLYVLTSYKTPSAFERWEPATLDAEREEYEYREEKPMPGWEDTVAVAAWGDVDLADDLKPDRPDLDADTSAIAERAYEAYVDAFADLYGGRDAVFMLDSVGGAYLFGAPAATLPIANHFADDADARARVMEAFVDRSNEYLRKVEAHVNETVDGAAEVVQPDWANNRNRLYKLPLALHGDHDAVVTPVDTEGDGITYREPTPFDAVDDALLNRTREWCASYTSTGFTDRVDDLMATLWPDEYAEADGGWRAALDRWVAAERAAERADERARERAQQRRERRRAERGADPAGTDEGGAQGTSATAPVAASDEAGITPFIQGVFDALDAIDTAEVIRQYACDEWDTGTDAAGKTEFNPSWRESASGQSCYVDHDANTFGDPGDGGGGYAVKAMALGEGIITDASTNLTGEDWRDAVGALRDAGYAVPLWTPERGSTRHDGGEYDEMPFWAVREAAVALGVLDADELVERTADDGETYLGFPSGETYNAALDAIEKAGLDHGRERATTDGGSRSDHEGLPDPPAESPVELDDDGRLRYPLDLADRDAALHLAPVGGGLVRFSVRDTDGTLLAAQTEKRTGKWTNSRGRTEVANALAHEAGFDDTAGPHALAATLAAANRDATEHHEFFEAAMRSDTERDLRRRTTGVLARPSEAEEETVWEVTLDAPDDSPVDGERTITLDAAHLFNDTNATAFKRKHGATFHVKSEPDGEEWSAIVDWWLSLQEIGETEADHRVEAAVERFIDAVNQQRAWAFDLFPKDDSRAPWPGSLDHALYVEDHPEYEQDIILVRGAWVENWKRDNGFDDVPLDRELRDRDVMLDTSNRRRFAGAQYSLWPLNAATFTHTAATVRTRETDGEAPTSECGRRWTGVPGDEGDAAEGRDVLR